MRAINGKFLHDLWRVLLLLSFNIFQDCCNTKTRGQRTNYRARERPVANIKSNFLTCFHPVHGSNLFQKYSHLEWISVWIVDGSVAPPGTLDLACLIAMPVWQRQQRWPKGVSVELHYLCLAFGDLSACITGEEFVILQKKQSAPSRLLVM